MKFNYLNDLIKLREKQRKHEGFIEATAKLLISNTLSLFKPFKTWKTVLIQDSMFLKDFGASF